MGTSEVGIRYRLQDADINKYTIYSGLSHIGNFYGKTFRFTRSFLSSNLCLCEQGFGADQTSPPKKKIFSWPPRLNVHGTSTVRNYRDLDDLFRITFAFVPVHCVLEQTSGVEIVKRLASQAFSEPIIQ